MKKGISVLLVCLLLGSFVISAAAYGKGDVTGDGEITAEDARLCLRQAVGLETYEADSEEFAACDVTGDGEVTAEDARLILRAAVGLDSFDVPEPDPENNEYNILRSGTFYAVGNMHDTYGTNQPIEIAITSNSVYMLTQMDGIELAMLQTESSGTSLLKRQKKLYLLYPEKKIYMELSSAVLSMMGMDADELVDVKELGFSDMPALPDADSVEIGEFNGQPCRIYTFITESGGKTIVYMNGNRLLGFADVSSFGTSTTTISSITANVPADKSAPPKDYKKVLMMRFMQELGDVFM